MVIYTNNKNDISIDTSKSGIIADYNENTYIIKLPTVTCSDYKHAKTIQEAVNAIIQRTSKILLNLENEEK